VFKARRDEMERGDFVSDRQKTGIVFSKLRSQQNLKAGGISYVVV
jgi:hypothetical protein